MSIETFAAFVAAATVLTMTLGLDAGMVLRSASAEGVRMGVATALGIALGCLCGNCAAAFGLAALPASWPIIFDLLASGGAVYLAWLGAQLILRPREALLPVGNSEALEAVRRGFTTDALSPEVELSYPTLVPEFMPERASGSGPALMLAGTHVIIASLRFSVISALTDCIRPWLRRPGVMPVLGRVTGGVFVLLELRLVQVTGVHA
jgi:threonine/homoserine/homoserine lactone efflux protein